MQDSLRNRSHNSKKRIMKDSLPKLTEKAQKVFNAWVRRRDTCSHDYAFCISCSKIIYPDNIVNY